MKWIRSMNSGLICINFLTGVWSKRQQQWKLFWPVHTNHQFSDHHHDHMVEMEPVAVWRVKWNVRTGLFAAALMLQLFYLLYVCDCVCCNMFYKFLANTPSIPVLGAIICNIHFHFLIDNFFKNKTFRICDIYHQSPIQFYFEIVFEKKIRAPFNFIFFGLKKVNFHFVDISRWITRISLILFSHVYELCTYDSYCIAVALNINNKRAFTLCVVVSR